MQRSVPCTTRESGRARTARGVERKDVQGGQHQGPATQDHPWCLWGGGGQRSRLVPRYMYSKPRPLHAPGKVPRAGGAWRVEQGRVLPPWNSHSGGPRGPLPESCQGRSLTVTCARENQQLVQRAEGMEIQAPRQGGLFRSRKRPEPPQFLEAPSISNMKSVTRGVQL